MLGLQGVLRVLKAAFHDTDDLESWLRDRNPQNEAELNYWIEQYQRYQSSRSSFGSDNQI